MSESVYTIEIELSPEEGPPFKTAGPLIVAVVPPRDDTFATVVINPAVAGYTESVGNEDFTAKHWTELAVSEDSHMGEVRVGDSHAKHFAIEGVDYRITLQAVDRVTRPSGKWPVYHFLIEGGESDSAVLRNKRKESILKEHVEAVAANDPKAVVAAAEDFTSFVEEELASELADRRNLGMMLSNQAIALLRLGERQQARECLSTLQTVPNPEKNLGIEEQSATALFHRAGMNEEDGLTDDAIADYDELDRRYNQYPSLGAMLLVVQSLMRKGELLETKCGKHEAAVAVVDTVIARYGNRTEPAVVEWINHARRVRAGLKPG